VKSKELIFTAGSARATSAQLPSQCLEIERATSLRTLGIIVSDRLTVTEHLLSFCSSVLYALRVLRSHGLPATALQDVFEPCSRRCQVDLQRASLGYRHVHGDRPR